MKVLFIQNIEGIGGSENYFLEIIPKLIEKGIEVSFLSIYLKKYEEQYLFFESKLNQLEIPNSSFCVNRYFSLIPFRQINKYIKKSKYDIIHTHLVYADLWVGMLKKYGKIKNVLTVSTIHGYSENIYQEYCLKPSEVPKNLYYKLVKRAHSNIDHTYACSEGLKKFYKGIGIDVKGGMDVIEHGFNFKKFKGEVKKSKNIELLIVGRIMPIKQHELVINLMPKLLEKNPNVKLNIVGEGQEKKSLEELVAELKLKEHVIFHGFSDEVEMHYSNCDIVLVPSFAEGLPLVILEAFNYKKPVVAFRTIGCEDVITDSENGFLIPPYNSEIFQEKLMDLINNEDKRISFGEKGRNAVDQKYNIEVMTSNTLDYYKKVLS